MYTKEDGQIVRFSKVKKKRPKQNKQKKKQWDIHTSRLPSEYHTLDVLRKDKEVFKVYIQSIP